MAVDTSIDEFFDERLHRVLGAPPPTAETGSWYLPPPSDTTLGSTQDAMSSAQPSSSEPEGGEGEQ